MNRTVRLAVSGGYVGFRLAKISGEGIITKDGQEFRGWRDDKFLAKSSA